MRALVTGAHGFAGSWLAKSLLDSGSEVSSLDREGVSPTGLELHGIAGDVNDLVGDLRDYDLVIELLRDNSIDSVFHLAAQAIVGDANASPIPTFEINIEGTWALLEACREAGVELVVVASSDKAYGPHEELPYTEESALQPIFPYDVSKAAADLIARSYWHTYGLPVAVTRFANLYGGGDRNFSRLIPETVSAVLDGRRPVIRSDGTPERDFLYVEDAARAYLTIAGALAEGRAGGEAFNAGSGRPHPVREVVELICELGPTEVEPDYQGAGSPSGEIDRQYLDSTKIREQTGWEPAVELRDGIERTLDWYRAHPGVRPAAASA
ncbi:MAG TPA: NAD-dependent epimerase/dehydratase family protein [Solirubrobacterales bacterium]|nr:NAD-dependent epimerase/dehydratase family protein [Solirubrobacterales bacterium]